MVWTQFATLKCCSVMLLPSTVLASTARKYTGHNRKHDGVVFLYRTRCSQPSHITQITAPTHTFQNCTFDALILVITCPSMEAVNLSQPVGRIRQHRRHRASLFVLSSSGACFGTSESSFRYLVIGHCYVHGILSGTPRPR